MMRRVVVVWTLLVMAAVASAQDPLAAATDAYRQGDFPQAAKLFAQAAEAEAAPAARAEIRVKLAWTYYAMKSRSRAEEALAAALADNPGIEVMRDYYTDDFLALVEKVRKRLASGASTARTTTQPARPVQPPSGGTLAGLRQRLAQAPDPPAVEAVLADLATLEMTYPPQQLPEVLELKVEVLDRLGRSREALELRGRLAALRASSQALPGTSAVPLDILLEARRYLASSRADDAVALLRGVLAAQPSCVPAIEVLAEALAEAGRLDEASDAVRTAMMGGEKPDLLLLQGEIELRRNRPDLARNAFRRLVEIDLGNDRGWASLGLLAARSGDLATARDALDKALRSNGMLFEARVVRAQLCLLDGQTQPAIQHLQRATQLKPDDPWAQGWLGMAFLTAGNVASAVEKLDLAVKADQLRFALPLAEALRRQGKLEMALQVLDRLPADEPLHAQAQWDEALALLERARELTGTPSTIKQSIELTAATRRAQILLAQAEAPPPPPAKK
ncbi:MAG: tetratricopeptide repeat protein [Thermoanaerobaculaceae bacterium]|nr:tetratricopeptide repeat protein [Thermoanaerobaculaceae bacterium]